MDIYTNFDLNNLRRECVHLDELLISTSDVEFNDLLGEGTYITIICHVKINTVMSGIHVLYEIQ